MTDQTQYRIFVSYAHEHKDEKLMRLVCKHLREKLGMYPVVDSDLTPGRAFTDEIQHKIASSHLFLPLLTVNSTKRPWVHQEMGYAMAMHVPILPLVVNGNPESSGMARELHALSVTGEDLSVLSLSMVTHRIESAFEDTQAPSVFTQTVEQRQDGIHKHTREILNTFGPQRIFQAASFSSFSLPDEYPGHILWKQRNPNFGENFCALARKERQIMEEHAKEKGCSLRLDFYIPSDGHPEPILKHDPDRIRPRLTVLREFLESMPDDKVTMVICKGKTRSVLMAVGDMLLVEAPIPLGCKQYDYSIFSWHAPTVAQKAKELDNEIMSRLKELGIPPEKSRGRAIDEIDAVLKSI